MRNRCFNGELGELKTRIAAEEKRFFLISMDRKIAEELKDDEKILQADQKLESITAILKVLHSQLPDGE